MALGLCGSSASTHFLAEPLLAAGRAGALTAGSARTIAVAASVPAPFGPIARVEPIESIGFLTSGDASIAVSASTSASMSTPVAASAPDPELELEPRPEPAPEPAADPVAAAKKPPAPAPLFPLEAAWSYSLKTPLTVWPAYDDSSMYVALSTGELVALTVSPTSATPRWTLSNIEVTFPLAADGARVYAATDDAVRALEASKGTSLWHHPAGGRLSTAPVARAGWLILALDTGEVRALRGDSGEEVWKLALGAPVKSEPLIDGNRLYLTPENNRIVAVDLLAGKVLWDRDMSAVVNSVAAFRNGVFVGTTGRMFYALNDRDGVQRWKWRIGNDAVGRALFTDERVYVVFMDNSIRAFALDNGGQRWRQPIDFRAHAGALRIEETIVVAGLSPVLRGYRTDTGKPAGNFTLPVGPQAQVAAPLRFVQGSYFLDDLIVTITQEGDIVAARRKAGLTALPQTEPFGLLGESIVWPILPSGPTLPESSLVAPGAAATPPGATPPAGTTAAPTTPPTGATPTTTPPGTPATPPATAKPAVPPATPPPPAAPPVLP